jgi:CheY-like chemotaxis protein
MATLLIVDDQPGLSEGISTFFEGQGHKSMVATGVTEAMDMVQSEKPDLVVSDLMMDDGTGLILRQKIAGLDLEVQPYFILMTAHPTHDSALAAYRSGVDLYLTKPFQLPAMALAVNQGLRHRGLQAGQDPVMLRRAESFYHDFFLILNPVLPRLLMLVEGRYGVLNEDQLSSVSAVFETWRRLVWTMADFYHRLLQPDAGDLEVSRWHGPLALKRVLLKLAPDLQAGGMSTELLAEAVLPLASVHTDTAEALLETVILRLIALSGHGATLTFHWQKYAGKLRLNVFSDTPNPRLTPELIRNVSILPPVLPLLAEAGVQVQVTDDLGPWSLIFG